ncbi:hypothetical protein Hs30E_08140 [Lactococcus hodotermopsidis]|uniref:AAA+ ATPase domain-containing protein n=2 Tax=Pseudolactococcus hodotermopsidis TaxID=2709157 RepID=A0A6A0BC52_9LACT|nr:hypothetical protein Hs30E_08140 [Lactococcus hodotermopsidis]
MKKILDLEPHHCQIHEGESLLIKGAIACGKTKLLLEIAEKLPKNQFDFLFQDIDDNFVTGTVAENLAFNLENDAVAHDKMVAMVQATAEKFELTDFLTKDVREIPTRQKQILALAQILIQPTDILLLDEPLLLPYNFDDETTAYTGTLIVTGNFDERLFDHVIHLTDESTEIPNVKLTRKINPHKKILSVHNLIEDLSFVIYEGEKVALSIESDVPLADMLTGFLPTTSGEVYFYYEAIGNMEMKRLARRIGYVMANPADMIFVNRVSEYHIPDDLLTLCGLETLKNKKISELTFRQKRLFTIATILMLKTPIVIFDQPDFAYFPEILAYLDQKGVSIIALTENAKIIDLMDRQEVF